MNYAIQILQKALAKEYMTMHTISKVTAGQGFHMSKATSRAFNERQDMANKRIPELEEALKKLDAI